MLFSFPTFFLFSSYKKKKKTKKKPCPTFSLLDENFCPFPIIPLPLKLTRGQLKIRIHLHYTHLFNILFIKPRLICCDTTQFSCPRCIFLIYSISAHS